MVMLWISDLRSASAPSIQTNICEAVDSQSPDGGRPEIVSDVAIQPTIEGREENPELTGPSVVGYRADGPESRMNFNRPVTRMANTTTRIAN